VKWVKAPQIPGEAARAWTMILLLVLPFTLLVVLASSTSDDQYFCEIVTLYRPPLHQDWGRARTASPVMTKSWGKQLPGERPRETAEERHTSPQPSRKKKATPRLAAQKSRPHAPLAPMRSAPAYLNIT
jgi:hypothetical protein